MESPQHMSKNLFYSVKQNTNKVSTAIDLKRQSLIDDTLMVQNICVEETLFAIGSCGIRLKLIHVHVSQKFRLRAYSDMF